jgi:hypothetical protein
LITSFETKGTPTISAWISLPSKAWLILKGLSKTFYNLSLIIVIVDSPVKYPGTNLLIPHYNALAILSWMKLSDEISVFNSKVSETISTLALPISSMILKSIRTLGILISNFMSWSLPITGTSSKTPSSNYKANRTSWSSNLNTNPLAPPSGDLTSQLTSGISNSFALNLSIWVPNFLISSPSRTF